MQSESNIRLVHWVRLSIRRVSITMMALARLEVIILKTARSIAMAGAELSCRCGIHGQLTNNFIESILLDKKPIVDICEALNMTMAGVIAH